MSHQGSSEGEIEWRQGSRPFVPPLRTDTETADCGSSHAIRSTTQSVDDYVPDVPHGGHEVASAVIAGTGGQFQTPVTTPSRNTPMQSPIHGKRTGSGETVHESSSAATSSIMDGKTSVRRDRGFKRRGSDLEEAKHGQRNPLHWRSGQGSRTGRLSEDAGRLAPSRVTGGDDEYPISHASLTETEGDGSDISSKEGYGDDDDYDDDEKRDTGESETVESEGPLTPTG